MEPILYTSLGGLTLPYRLRFPENEARFPRPDPALPAASIPPVFVSDEDCAYYGRSGFPAGEEPPMEFSVLTANFSDALLAFDRIIVHGVAVRWRDRAWLICAGPGVGKSTQARWLRELRPGEFGVICGDRPILEFRHCEPCRDGTPPSAASPVAVGAVIGRPPEPTTSHECHSERSAVESKNPFSPSPDSAILVHPSPWNGKEDWYGAEAAPLAGLILLERGEENRLVSLTEREAALPMYVQLIHSARSAEALRRAADLETRLLNAVPIWRLTTHRVPDSTHLLLETIFSS